MKNFLEKEIKLCLSAVNYLFLAFVAMIIIPNYPCYVPFYYLCLSIFFIFNNAELNKDIQYSMVLPITKKDMVKSRCILVCVYEIAGALFTIPFAILINSTYKRTLLPLFEKGETIKCKISLKVKNDHWFW